MLYIYVERTSCTIVFGFLRNLVLQICWGINDTGRTLSRVIVQCVFLVGILRQSYLSNDNTNNAASSTESAPWNFFQLHCPFQSLVLSQHSFASTPSCHASVILLSIPKFNQQLSSTEFEVRLHSYPMMYHRHPTPPHKVNLYTQNLAELTAAQLNILARLY
jgi:hypothetical protein